MAMNMGGMNPIAAQLVRRLSEENDMDEAAAAATSAAGGGERARRQRTNSSEWLTPRASASHNIRRMAEEALVPDHVRYSEFEADINMRRARRSSLDQAAREQAAMDMAKAMANLQSTERPADAPARPGGERDRRRSTMSLTEMLEAKENELRAGMADQGVTIRTPRTGAAAGAPGASKTAASAGAPAAAPAPSTSFTRGSSSTSAAEAKSVSTSVTPRTGDQKADKKASLLQRFGGGGRAKASPRPPPAAPAAGAANSPATATPAEKRPSPNKGRRILRAVA